MRWLGIAFIGVLATFAVVTVAAAQPFLLETSPQSITITGGSASFNVSTSAQVGFKASIYFKAECPSLPQATVTVSPAIINAPYLTPVVVTVTLTGPKNGGTHDVYIIAHNGGVEARDTVQITIPNRTTWTVFPPTVVSGDFEWKTPTYFALDRKNGIGWVTSNDSLRSYDGNCWHSYPWPDSTSSEPYYRSPEVGYSIYPLGICVDSAGSIWVTVESGAILRFDGTDWTIFGHEDTAAGLTSQIFGRLAGHYGQSSDITAGSYGTIWALGWHSLVQYDGEVWTEYTSENSDMGYPGKWIATDRTGNVWIQKENSGVVRFDGLYWTTYSSEYFNDGYELGFRGIGRDNSIWLATNAGQGSTIRFYADSGSYVRYGWNTPGFLGKLVKAVDIDADGDTWVGTSPNFLDLADHAGGMARFDGTDWWLYTIANSGLPSNDVMDVQVDDNKKVWILTADGSLTILDGTVAPSEAFTGLVSGVATSGTTTEAAQMEVTPNPLAGTGAVRLHLPTSGPVKMTLVNNLGQVMMTLVDDLREAGDQIVPINTDGLPAGAYFLQLNAGDRTSYKPVIVAR